MRSPASVLLVLCVFQATQTREAVAAISVHLSDFIPTVSRTNFNGFEGLPATATFTGPYTEDGVTVEEIETPPREIDTYYAGEIDPNYAGRVQEGDRSWRGNGGSFGYTKITRADGSGFLNMGFRIANDNSEAGTMLYRLMSNGNLVLSGSFDMYSHRIGFLGFSGGGFDEVDARVAHSAYGWNGSDFFHFRGGGSLHIDSVELADAVPEPSSEILLALVAIAMVRLRWTMPPA